MEAKNNSQYTNAPFGAESEESNLSPVSLLNSFT
ncbi:hypothetical protein BCVP_CDS0017 [Bacillus phage BC-VP]|nr:hypothetical protein BCVP_CDS0017 [Bacillus phage BC-VP]